MVSVSSRAPRRPSKGRTEAEKFIQSTLDALSAHIAILDQAGNIVGVNHAWRKFADENDYTSRAYGIGINYLDVCDTSSDRQTAPKMAQGIRDVIVGSKDDFELEYPCHSPTEKRWFVVRVSRFDWAEDTFVIVAHQNVSELKHVQIELQNNTHRLEAIVNNIKNGILTLDAHGCIHSANEAALQLFDYQEDMLLGQSLGNLLLNPLHSKQPLQSLKGANGHELMGVRANGEQFPIHLMLRPLHLDQGHMYACIIEDMSDRKRAEAEIIARERVTLDLEKERDLRDHKNRFLSMMSHELRTPLASIRLSYDMIKKYGERSTPEERDQALDNIHTQVELLADMVSDVMTLSRTESGTLNFEPEDVDLITYCRDVVEEFQFNYHKSHSVVFECEARTIRTSLDRKLLRRALTNLLSNAIKYSIKGGTITFELKQEADQAIIQVTDSGIGIPLEDQPRLFEPFHRASNAEKLNVPGTGLGLPITKQIVELHSGQIEFTSVQDKGTTFTITLPITCL